MIAPPALVKSTQRAATCPKWMCPSVLVQDISSVVYWTHHMGRKMNDQARLQVAAETLRKAARKRQSRLWRASIRRLRELGWLGKPEIQDALLMAPVSWLQQEGLAVSVPTRDEERRLVIREVPAEAWEVVDAVIQALDVFGSGTQLVQLRKVGE